MSKGLIIAGVIVFLIMVTLPVWYTLAAEGSGARKQPVLPDKNAKVFEGKKYRCVEDKEFMIPNHMKLLIDWRDTVVRAREGERFYISKAHGVKHEISLTKTCLKCHTSKANFCDRCHDYADVHPDCWNCHVVPEGK